MLIFICTRKLVVSSYKFHWQNALSPAITLFSSKFSGLISPQSAAAAAAAYSSPCERKQEKSQAVLTLLRGHGFPDTQISKLVKQYPRVLSADPKKSLLPKIEFLRSIGITSVDLATIIVRFPNLLASSLEKKLVPGYNFLKSILLSDEIVAKSVKIQPRILFSVVGGAVTFNLDVLKGVGVPPSSISFMLSQCPSVACQNHDKLKIDVGDVINMGIDPLKIIFIIALRVKCEISKLTWDHRVEVYRKWGLSNEEILLAFRKHPACMTLSDEKITRAMDLLVNKMSWKPAIIAGYPTVLFYSLEKRIIPRCRVIKVLIAKGLVNKTVAPASFLVRSERQFLDRFVRNYQDELPGLINIYLEPGFVTEDSPVMKQL